MFRYLVLCLNPVGMIQRVSVNLLSEFFHIRLFIRGTTICHELNYIKRCTKELIVAHGVLSELSVPTGQLNKVCLGEEARVAV